MTLEAMPISKLAQVRSGGGAPQDPNSFTPTGYPFVRAGSLPKLLGGESEDSLEKLQPTVAEEHGLSLFPAGTVLFAKSGMSATKGHIYRLRGPAYVVNHLAALTPHDPGDSAFLVRALQRFPPTVLIKDQAYPSIRLGDIERMKIHAPVDPSRRQRIAEILDKADVLRAKRRAALAQLDTLTQSIFLDMFGDPVRHQPGQLPTVRDAILQRKLLEIQDGNHGEKHPKVEDFSDEGVPFITANCLNDDRLDLTNCYFLPASWLKWLRIGFSQAGDVLLSHKGSIGLTAIVPARDGPIILSPQVTYYRVNPDCLLPEFLRGFFQTTSFQAKMKKEAEQTTRSYLGITRQLDLPLLLPPIELQHEFARRVAATDKLKLAQRSSMVDLDTLVASLQQRAFQGEL